MLKRKFFEFKRLSHRLSVRSAASALFAVISSLAAVLFDQYVPDEMGDLVGGKAVDGILTMMASSMLIVVTFALSTMVSAYATATQIATPRATALLIDDSRSHSAISVFLGTFIYSVVSLIALSTGYYGEKGRVILLLVSVLFLIAVVWTIIRWVDELKNMSSVRETIKRVEKVTSKALQERVEHPTFGCSLFHSVPEHAEPIDSLIVGHIQNIDLSRLAEIATEKSLSIYVENDVGAFIHLGSKLAYVEGMKLEDEKLIKEIRECFIIGNIRTFDFDPRYGITVMAGIGIKALSPSLNDPGTAIDVISSLVRVLSYWDRNTSECKISEVKYKRIFFPELSVHDLFNDAFYSLAKEGANNLLVIKMIEEGFDALSSTNNEKYLEAILEHRKLVTTRTENGLMAEDLKNLNSFHMIGENQRHINHDPSAH